jgi:hypothetical protein
MRIARDSPKDFVRHFRTAVCTLILLVVALSAETDLRLRAMDLGAESSQSAASMNSGNVTVAGSRSLTGTSAAGNSGVMFPLRAGVRLDSRSVVSVSSGLRANLFGQI